MKLFTTVGAIVGSYVGWYFGSPLGFGWAFVISGVGSLVGVYLGWKAGMRWLN